MDFDCLGAWCLQNLKSLKSLKISGWTEVTTNGFLVFRGLPNMVSLDVSSCTKVSNKIVKVIAESMPALSELDLVNCFQIDSSGLDVLRKMSELENLKLSRHTKGDIENQLQHIKNIEMVSSLQAASRRDLGQPTNFQHVLEKYSWEEEGRPRDSRVIQTPI